MKWKKQVLNIVGITGLVAPVIIAGFLTIIINEAYAQADGSYQGASGSGKDLVIELSHDYLEQIIHKKFQQLGRICFSHDRVPIPITINGDTVIVEVEVRNVVPVLDAVWLTQIGPAVQAQIFVNLRLRLLYGQVREQLLTQGTWKTLDELGLTERQRQFSFSAGLRAWPELTRVMLIVDTSTIPDWIPANLLEALGENIPIPVNFLDQTQRYEDDAGNEQVLTLLAIQLNSVDLKLVQGGHLAFGIDVELSQDEDARVLGPQVPQNQDPIVAGPDDLVPHRCGLPGQPDPFQEEDLLRFRVDFTESFLDNSDWAIAFDAHIVDAILRGLPSASMNVAGHETDECEHDDAVRSFCFELMELQNDNIRVRGNGEIFVCYDPEPIDVVSNDFYEICVETDVTLSLTNSVPRRLNAHYTLTNARCCGDDAGFNFWVDAMDRVPSEFRENDIQLRTVPTRIGEPDDPAGELTIEALTIRSDGLIFRGSGSIRSGAPILQASTRLLFAANCDAAQPPFRRTFAIANEGTANLHICPPVIRADPEGNSAHASFFSIVRPRRLQTDGEGLSIGSDEQREIDIELNADPGERYTALLDIPNNATSHTIRLSADLRPTRPILEATVLSLRHTDYAQPCTGEFPRIRPIRRSLDVSNDGPGNLQICSISLPVMINANGDAVFLAGRGTYPRYLAAGVTDAIEVIFNPGLDDIGHTFHGPMTIHTNAGDTSVTLVGSLQHSVDVQFPGVMGSFEEEIFCGDADWDRIQDSGGRILDVRQVAEFFSLLGGEDCCPAPRGPACLCLDFWEIAFSAVPSGLAVQVQGQNGQIIARNYADSPDRLLIVPITEGNEYALQARILKSVTHMPSSPLIMRRWLVQQDGLHTTSQQLNDLAVIGDHAYAVGPICLEIISLAKPQQPERVAIVPGIAGATGVAAFGSNLLVARGHLEVYSLANPGKLIAVSKLNLNSDVKIIVTATIGSQSEALAYALGQRLHVIDLSDPLHPKEVGNITTRVPANQALLQGNHAYIFGDNGMEVFDLSKPGWPIAVAFLPTQRQVRNALLLGSLALLVYDSREIDLVDISKPGRPQRAGDWQLESWIKEFVPLTGSFVQYRNQFLLLRGDQYGFRVLRMRRNSVDQTKLQQRRDAARSSSNK